MENNEKMGLGAIGAFIGSLVGVAAVVLLSKIGFYASIAGVIMAVCALKLYKSFSGTQVISKKGLIICIIIMVVASVLAENIAFTLQVLDELKEAGYEGDFLKIFLNLYSYMSQGYLEVSTYVLQLFMVLVFNAVGAASQIKANLGVQKNNIQPNNNIPVQNYNTTNNQNVNNTNVSNNDNTNNTNTNSNM